MERRGGNEQHAEPPFALSTALLLAFPGPRHARIHKTIHPPTPLPPISLQHARWWRRPRDAAVGAVEAGREGGDGDAGKLAGQRWILHSRKTWNTLALNLAVHPPLNKPTTG
jgi:hypothetical protein